MTARPLRREVFGTATTPLTASVQTLLKDVIAALPGHTGPFVLSFASSDPALARYGAEVAALGVERIGSKALLLDQPDVGTDARQYRFIFVTDDHPLAVGADLHIDVLGIDAVATLGTIGFRLPPSQSQRPPLVETSGAQIVAATG